MNGIEYKKKINYHVQNIFNGKRDSPTNDLHVAHPMTDPKKIIEAYFFPKK